LPLITAAFIAGLLGVEHSSNSTGTESTPAAPGIPDTPATRLENSSTRFGFGAAFGMHAFLNQAVSLDPEFSVLRE